jgi:hypothetical protein
VFICDECVAQATRLSAGAVLEDRAEGTMRLEPSGSKGMSLAGAIALEQHVMSNIEV